MKRNRQRRRVADARDAQRSVQLADFDAVRPPDTTQLYDSKEESQLDAPLDAKPFDEGCLDRCRELWRRGQWSELADLSVDDLEHHPQRARLALMVASANQAIGQGSSTRLFVQLSRQWGADPTLVARVLIGGVHNTLGRASAICATHRASTMYHFREAVTPGASHSARALLTRIRAEAQLTDMGLGDLAPRLLTGGVDQVSTPALITTPLKELRGELQTQAAMLADVRKEHAEQLVAARRGIEATVKRETANAIRQIEAFQNMQAFLAGRRTLPEVHGWPVSPDLAMLLVRLVEQERFDAIVEFGSGTSTLILAQAQAQAASRGLIDAPKPQLAFEHLAQYHNETKELLIRSGLQQQVELMLAPLEPMAIGEEEQFLFYTCHEALRALAQRLEAIPNPRILVFVDGPPGPTGPLARYPAMPAVTRAIPSATGLLLLDDYERADERAVAKRWQEELTRDGREPVLTEHALEKMAVSIRYCGRRIEHHHNEGKTK